MSQIKLYTRGKKKAQSIVYKALNSQKPDFMIIGAQKSGTSSLHHFLSQHPNVVGSKPKELHFLIERSIFLKILIGMKVILRVYSQNLNFSLNQHLHTFINLAQQI
ncbi:MAG: sulfotransferase domain-containing protein [bacterium]